MHTFEEIEARMLDFTHSLNELGAAVTDVSHSANRTCEMANSLKNEHAVVLYGEDSDGCIRHDIQARMDEMLELHHKKIERIQRMRRKNNAYINNFFKMSLDATTPEMALVYKVIKNLIERGRIMEPLHDLSDIISVLNNAMEKIHKIKTRYAKDGTMNPDVQRFFTTVQNLLFDLHNIYLDEQKHRKREDELLTPDLRRTLEKFESMPFELWQEIIEGVKIISMCTTIDEHINGCMAILTNSDDVFDPLSEIFEKIMQSDECDESDAECFCTTLAELRLFVADMTAAARKGQMSMDRIAELLKQSRAAFDYYRGEIE